MARKMAPKAPLGLFIAAFLAVFTGFMAWYFAICSGSGIAPSDWALMALAVVCAVECLACAFIKTRPSNRKGLTEAEKGYIETAVAAAAAVLGVEAPSMREASEGGASCLDMEEDDEEGGSL